MLSLLVQFAKEEKVDVERTAVMKQESLPLEDGNFILLMNEGED